MPVRKLYGTLQSPATLKVFTCLLEHDLEFEFIPIDMKAGEHKKQPFLSLNPFGQVPAYEDGEFTYYESRAICRAMSHHYFKNKKGEELIVRDARLQAQVALWIEVEDQDFEPPASEIIKQFLWNPKTGLNPDEVVVAEAEAKLAKVLDVYEAQLTKFKYLCYDKFSLVDLLHLPNLQYLMETPAKKLFDSRPHVKAWCADIMARPSWTKVVEMQKNAKVI